MFKEKNEGQTHYFGDGCKDIHGVKMDVQTKKEQLRDFAESWEQVGYHRGYDKAKKEDMLVLAILLKRLDGSIEVSDLEKAKAEFTDIIVEENRAEMKTTYKLKEKP